MDERMKKFFEFEKGLEEMQKKYEEMKAELFGQKKKKEEEGEEEQEEKLEQKRKMKKQRMGFVSRFPMFGRSLFDDFFDDYGMFGGRSWLADDYDRPYAQSFFGGGLPLVRRRYLPQLFKLDFSGPTRPFASEFPYLEQKPKPKKKKKKKKKPLKKIDPYSYTSHYTYQKVNDREHETKRIMDSRTGYSEVETRKIGDRGYSIEKEKKLGEEKENEKKTFHNLDEKDLDNFEKDWNEKFEKEKMIEGKPSEEEEEEEREGEKEE